MNVLGFRFKKSINIGGGAKLNIGRKSAGVSFGGKHGGVSVNSKTGARARASIPGTGLSYSAKLSGGRKSKSGTSRRVRENGKAIERPSTKADQRSDTGSRQVRNPRKPPKSSKVYTVCGISLTLIGILMLFLFWPLGIVFAGVGVYYIVCGPKIYSNLVERYKETHPEFEEGT